MKKFKIYFKKGQPVTLFASNQTEAAKKLINLGYKLNNLSKITKV